MLKGEGDHNHSKQHTIDDEEIEGVRAEKTKEESNNRHSQNGRYGYAHEKWLLHTHGKTATLHDSVGFQQYGSGGNGGEQQKAKSRCGFAVQAAGKSGGNRRPRARDAGNQGERLSRTGQDRVDGVDSGKGPALAAEFFREPHQQPDHYQHRSNEQVVFSKFEFGILVEQLARDRARHGPQSDPPKQHSVTTT